MMRHRILSLFAVAGLYLCWLSPAAAERIELVRIESLVDQYIAARVMEEVYDRAGIDVTITALPGARALSDASSGKKDGETMRIYQLGDQVKTLVRVPTPIMYLQTAAFGRKDKKITVKTAVDLNKYQVVVIRGVLHTEPYQTSLNNVLILDHQIKALELVNKGRADLVLVNRMEGEIILRTGNFPNLRLINPEIQATSLHHYLHTSKAHLVPVIDAVLQEMSGNGELEHLIRRLENSYPLGIDSK